jgi:hypothetical protein
MTVEDRLAKIKAIGERIVLQPDVSGRFLWAEYGLQGELLASLGGVPEIMVAGARFGLRAPLILLIFPSVEGRANRSRPS